jgi:hypothetical protein
MGGPGSGRKPGARQRRAAVLRARGLSLAEIGRHRGCSKQAVYQLLHKVKIIRAPENITCRVCGAVLCAARQGMWTVRYAVCLTCLDKTPGAG